VTSRYVDDAAVGQFIDSQRAMVLQRYGHAVDRSQRALDRWDARWAESLTGDVPTASDGDLERLLALARADSRALSKAFFGPRLRAGVEKLLSPMRGRVRRTQDWYSRRVSEDAGQHALDVLGINRPWSWGEESAIERLESARGSKAIEDLYGDHVDRLTKIIERESRDRSAKSDRELADRIQEEWSGIVRWKAEQIARTESAHMWEATNFVAYVANGVTEFDWLVATGPGVEPGSVCTRCLSIATLNPYTAEKAPLPPRHPLCRCTLVPALGQQWRAPSEPWTGGSK